MVVTALPPARGSGGDSSTMSLAVRVSLRRFRAMVISVPIFSVLLRLVFALPRGSRRRDAAAFSSAFSIWRGCRFPWFRVVWGGLWVCFPGLLSGPPETLVCPVSGASPPMLPRGGGVPLRASLKAGPEGCFLPFLPGVFRSGEGRRRPRAGRKITGPRKTDLCKKSARGYPATGCRGSTLGSVQ